MQEYSTRESLRVNLTDTPCGEKGQEPRFFPNTIDPRYVTLNFNKFMQPILIILMVTVILIGTIIVAMMIASSNLYN